MASIDDVSKALSCVGIDHVVVASSQLTQDDYEDLHTIKEKWLDDFAVLVRKYVPIDPDAIKDAKQSARARQLLRDIQDATSCYSPYIWQNKYKPKSGGIK